MVQRCFCHYSASRLFFASLLRFVHTPCSIFRTYSARLALCPSSDLDCRLWAMLYTIKTPYTLFPEHRPIIDDINIVHGAELITKTAGNAGVRYEKVPAAHNEPIRNKVDRTRHQACQYCVILPHKGFSLPYSFCCQA